MMRAMKEEMGAADAVPISAGQMELRARVTVTCALR
jgi:uncharacterized protein YggE